MKKIISNFELNIYRLLKVYENSEEEKDTEFKKCLYNQVLESLYTYQEDEWVDLNESFENMEAQVSFIKKALILFCIYSQYKDKIATIHSKLLFSLVNAFSYTNINPKNYNSYIDIILTQPIYNVLITYSENDIIDIISFLFISFEESDINLQSDYDYIYNIMFLYKFISWGEKSSLKTIQAKIKRFIKKYGELIFSQDEKDTIDNLTNILDESEETKNKLYDLQLEYQSTPITLIREIIKLCNKYKKPPKLYLIKKDS